MVASSIPAEVNNSIRSRLNVEILGFTFSSGGCINQGGKLRTSAGDFFLKWNSREKFPQMFAAESRGLQLLAQEGVVRVPHVILTAETSALQFIVLEFVDGQRRSDSFWKELGHQLALLHGVSSAQFGLDHDNYIGSLPQQNAFSSNWIDFFIERRLKVQLEMALRGGKLERQAGRNFEKLFQKLPSLIPASKPALLHGDLWTGNLIADAGGAPCLIDPAVYFGHPEAEIAFTTLFGAFPRPFYESYTEILPIGAGFNDRSEVYNLYPLLVHVNLFGGTYVSQVVSILKRLV